MSASGPPRARVLIVDDTPENIHILMAFLRRTCDLVAATNGTKALECARSESPPDLILLDVIMPGMSGYQVCEQLKSDPKTADIPIIFVTGLSDALDEEKGLGLGAADYITKPFRAGVVRARVKQQLELKHYQELLKKPPDSARHGEYLARLSHQLRAPLHAISGMAYLLAGTALDEYQCACLQDLEKGVQDLHKVVSELSEYTDGDPERLEVHAREFRLQKVLEGVIGKLTPRALEKEVELVSRTAPDVPELVLGDGPRLAQLLSPLLENAVKFAAGGRVSLQVEVLDERQLRFKVLDSGIGMTGEQLKSLWEASSVTGSRSGLALSRSLTDRLGGNLRVQSQAGQGTLVTVDLPLIAPADSGAAPRTRTGGPGRRVLLVEDSEVNQRIVSELLEQAGVPVELAENGQAALDLIARSGSPLPWRLILMDLQMPVMDGFAAARRIRRDHRFDQVPILAMSSHVLGEERDRCRQAGMDDFVSKPVDPDAWFTVLGQWLPLQGALEPQDFPPLSLVNSEAGMRACGGNKKFYRSLLLEFSDRCRRSVWELQAALAGDDRRRLKLLAHTLHGVGINLGAEQLAARCLALELEAIQAEPSALAHSLAELQKHLDQLAESLVVELGPSDCRPTAGPWTRERVQGAQAAVTALSGHLEKGLGDSLDSVQDLIALATPLDGDLSRLERLVHQFDFSGALRELREVQRKLPSLNDFASS